MTGTPAWLRELSGAEIESGSPPAATGIACDSRRVGAGDIFVAVPGMKADGIDFIAAARERGAGAVVVQRDRRARWAPHVSDALCVVSVPDARVALAEASAAVFGHPAHELGIVGVTGTDGKTTTTHLAAHVLATTGHRAGYLSSVAFSDGARDERNASHMTTLESCDVQRELRRIASAGARYAVVEASSIGLDLHRLDQCEFDVAVFTNLAPDHLDYHGDMTAYRDAKAGLFSMVASTAGKGSSRAAVLNADDPASDAMRRAAPGVPAITYGVGAAADLTAREIVMDGAATRFVVSCGGAEAPARVPLLGAFNVANSLAAVAAALSQGARFLDAVEALASFPGVPGRMERVDDGESFRVIVDIASTEPAMRNVLAAIRAATRGRIIVVFGAAGERDVARRSGIARAVAEAADFAVVANEDPRSEDPDAIIAEIARALAAQGFKEGRQFVREPDRREAIRTAFARARPGDTVLLAGKGTEPSIVVGATAVPWDERAVARELLGEARRV